MVLCRGECPVKVIEPGNVEKITTITFTIPELAEPVKAGLEIRLSAPGKVLNNHWDYWIFPTNRTSSVSKVRIVSELDAESLQYLTAGGRVVLFGHQPFPVKNMGFRMGLAGRWQGNLATVIIDHPLTNRFPHDGYCDWQFYPMLRDSNTIVFDDLKANFDPILEVVSTYKHVIKQASLFEWQVDKGRLLVCSLNLPASDPAASYLRWCILDYAGSSDFKPRTCVPAAELVRIMNESKPVVDKQTDNKNRAYDKNAQLKNQ